MVLLQPLNRKILYEIYFTGFPNWVFKLGLLSNSYLTKKNLPETVKKIHQTFKSASKKIENITKLTLFFFVDRSVLEKMAGIILARKLHR